MHRLYAMDRKTQQQINRFDAEIDCIGIQVMQVDQQIRVLYREDHPSEGYVDSFMDRWFFPLVFTFGGGIFAAIDYWSLRYRRC